MLLLPHEHFSITSTAPAEEILGRVRAAVEPALWLRNPFSRDHKPFQGEIVGNRFKLTRIIHYRNSFLPTVVGSVRQDGAGAIIEVTLRLNSFVTGFMVLWFGGVTWGFVAFATHALSHGGSPLGALVPAAMLLFGYLLVQGGFRFEASKAKRFLEELASAPSQRTAGAAFTSSSASPGDRRRPR